jgi:hypothetical protein
LTSLLPFIAFQAIKCVLFFVQLEADSGQASDPSPVLLICLAGLRASPKQNSLAKHPHLTQASLYSSSPFMASRYAAQHKNRQGPGDTRPAAFHIIQDEGFKSKLQDKTFRITGCSSGTGAESARAIAATEATT